jgi:hypothetical protein
MVAQLMGPDYTIAVDDAMCERFLTCLTCGQRRGVRSLDLVVVGGAVLAVARCLRCAAQDPTAARLIARLAQREATPR